MDQVQRKAYTTFVCLTCGKQVTVYGNDERKFCSNECFIEHGFGHRTLAAQAEWHKSGGAGMQSSCVAMIFFVVAFVLLDGFFARSMQQ